jgi:hypothetical protein
MSPFEANTIGLWKAAFDRLAEALEEAYLAINEVPSALEAHDSNWGL